MYDARADRGLEDTGGDKERSGNMRTEMNVRSVIDDETESEDIKAKNR